MSDAARRSEVLLFTARAARKGTEMPPYFVRDLRQGTPEPQAVLIAWLAVDVGEDEDLVERVDIYRFDGGTVAC